MKQYPLNLNLTGQNVLLVGGGRVAHRKLQGLLGCAARIIIVSPEIVPEIKALCESQSAGGETIVYRARKFLTEDIQDAFLIIAATGEQSVNAEISRLALASDKLINVVDNAALSNFTLPARVRRGDLLLTASTAGKSPALAREIRKKLTDIFLEEEYAPYLQLLGELRPVLIEKLPVQQRKKIFNQLADFKLIELMKRDRIAFREELSKILPVGIVKLDELL